MVKQNPFQNDLFDFSYIEEQVKNIKAKSEQQNNSNHVNESDSNPVDENINNFYDEQLAILNEIKYLLSDIRDQSYKKRRWFSNKGE